MHFAVIGAGSMGCLYGSNLARAGERVTMIDLWEEHVRALREGLRMEGLNGTFTAGVEATTRAEEVVDVDAAIVLVNAYATRAAAETAARVLKKEGYALTLQNGLGNIEPLSEVLGREHVLAGLSFHSADLRGPGHVVHTNSGPTYLGELDGGRSARLEALRTRLEAAGLHPQVEDNILATIWGKFVHNCGINALCALTDLRPGHLHQVPELDEFQTRIIREVLALVEAKGIELPEKRPLETIKAYCRSKFHRVSMAQHLMRGQLTEIDALNGYVVRESEKLGLEAPCNDALTRLMKGRHYRPEGFDAEAPILGGHR